MASKRRQRRKSCERKKKFSKEAAHIVAKRQWVRGEHIQAYACRHCGQWHVGHFGKPDSAHRVLNKISV